MSSSDVIQRPPSDETLATVQQILYRYQVSPAQAPILLATAVHEVAHRPHATSAARDARLVRAVERHARAYREGILRLWLKAPDELPEEEKPS